MRYICECLELFGACGRVYVSFHVYVSEISQTNEVCLVHLDFVGAVGRVYVSTFGYVLALAVEYT